MTDKRLRILFFKYFDGLTSQAEENEFYTLVKQKENVKPLEYLMEQKWESFQPTEVPFDLVARNRMLSVVYAQEELENNKHTKRIFWRRLAAAAAIFLLITSILLYFQLGKNTTGDNLPFNIAGINPGNSGATLTLSNGKKIRLGPLGNGNIANEAGVLITKSADGKLTYTIQGVSNATVNTNNTLSTARGETYQINLPDGSKVWLNAASSITYSSNLSKQRTRTVLFEGEGYFEVAEDKSRPFIVQSAGQEIKVLGTHFNVNTYPEEHDKKTTLIQGRVALNLPGSNKPFLLSPGEQAINSGGTVVGKSVDVEDAVAWKDGVFVFNGSDFRSMMLSIGRWYNVEVIFDHMPKNIAIEMHFSKDRDLDEVLKRLESAGNLRFKIEGREVHVIK